MPQINRYLYFEVDDGVNPIKTFGDKYVPKTISLNGPSKVEKRFNDLAATTSKQLLSVGAAGDIASYSFLAIRPSVAGTLTWEGTAGADPDNTSAVQLVAGEWFTLLSDDTVEHGEDTGILRSANTPAQAITGFWWYSSSQADIDVLAYS